VNETVPEERQLVDIATAARMLKRSSRHVRRVLKKNNIKMVTIRRRIFFATSDMRKLKQNGGAEDAEK